MNGEILTLPEPGLYELSGCPFTLPANMKIWGHSSIRPGGGVRLEHPSRTPSAIADGEQLAKEIKQSLSSIEIGSFDDEMKSLRGRSWSF